MKQTFVSHLYLANFQFDPLFLAQIFVSPYAQPQQALRRPPHFVPELHEAILHGIFSQEVHLLHH